MQIHKEGLVFLNRLFLNETWIGYISDYFVQSKSVDEGLEVNSQEL
jgi:hypothetical protein